MHNSVTLQQVFAWECPDCSDMNLLEVSEPLTTGGTEIELLEGFGLEDVEPQIVACKTCGREYIVDRDS